MHRMKYDDLLNDTHLVLTVEALCKYQDNLIPLMLDHEQEALQ